MSSLMVYHGTNRLFESVDLSKSKPRRDFGRGFYTTTIPSQAESWARSIVQRRHTGKAYVYEYELSLDGALRILAFDGLTLEWLDFVKENRSNESHHGYDIVMGPVANDNTLLTVNRYIEGVYTAEEAIRRLSYFRANDQVSLHTGKALACLHLTRRYRVE